MGNCLSGKVSIRDIFLICPLKHSGLLFQEYLQSCHVQYFLSNGWDGYGEAIEVCNNTWTERPSNQQMAGSNGRVHIITSNQEWEAEIFEANSNGKIVVVDFSVSWCGPCKIITPFYSELSEKYPQLVFLKLDVEEMPELSATWDVQAMPTFFFIKDGKQIDKLVGANKPELEKKVISYATAPQ